MTEMSDGWRARLRMSREELESYDDGMVAEFGDIDPEYNEDDPANDPTQEWTFVRDSRL